MADPTTSNLGLFIPNTGADVGTWGSNALNPDFVALDGMIAGVQTIGVSSSPITLTSPAGFTATPGGGPTQSQNRVLRFTGGLTADVRVTLPLPGSYLIDNRTTGAFVLSFQGTTATEVVAIDQGEILEVYNDGANVRFIGLGRVGSLEFWGGITTMPAWVNQCTFKPYLTADGTVYNFTDAPYLGAKYTNKFGGNGSTTFGTQDLRGRVPLAYSGGSGRITTAGCGIDGTVMGAAGGTQNVALDITQIPAHTHANTLTDPGHKHTVSGANNVTSPDGTGTFRGLAASLDSTTNTTGITLTNASVGGGAGHTNVQPSQVAGIWVVKT